MKRNIIIALALIAGVTTSEGKVKKTKEESRAEVKTSRDTLSYAAGMQFKDGLLPFLKKQYDVDSANIPDVVAGFKEAIANRGDKSYSARVAGTLIADMVAGRFLPQVSKDFSGTPDSINELLFYQGFIDGLEDKKDIMQLAEAEKLVSTKRTAYKEEKLEKEYGANRRAGEAFLAENAKKEGVKTLPSGLQYKVLVEGKGEKPTASDKVKVAYEGRTVDGTVFDSSYKRGDGTSEFGVKQVIKGWTEALQLMPKGSKWEVYIPYNLAYGERGAGDKIKPFSALIFTMELKDIVAKKAKNVASSEKK